MSVFFFSAEEKDLFKLRFWAAGPLFVFSLAQRHLGNETTISASDFCGREVRSKSLALAC